MPFVADATAVKSGFVPDKPAAPKFVPDKMGDEESFGSGFGKTIKTPWASITEDSIPANLYKGFKRWSGGEKVSIADALLGSETAAAIKDSPDSITGMMKKVGEFAVKNPGTFSAEMVNAITADPYLLLIPGYGWGSLSLKAATAGAKISTAAAKALPVVARVAGTGLEGAAMGAATEGAKQFADGEFDATGLKAASGFGLAAGALAGGVGAAMSKGAAPKVRNFKPLEAEKAIGGIGLEADPFGAAAGAAMRDAPKPALGMRRLFTSVGPDGASEGRWFTSDRAAAESFGPARYIDVESDPARFGSRFDKIGQSTDQFTAGRRYTDRELRDLRQPVTQAEGMIGLPETMKRDLVGAAKIALGGAAVGAGIGAAAQGLGGYEAGTTGYGATVGAMIGGIPRLFRKTKKLDVSELVNVRNGENAVRERRMNNFAAAAHETVPQPERRIAITHALEAGDFSGLSPGEKSVAQAMRAMYDEFGHVAFDKNILGSFLENYVPHVVEAINPNIDLLPKFSATRKMPTIAELKKALEDSGLQLKTEDSIEIARIYNESMFKAINDTRLVDALKDVRLPDGKALLVPASQAGPTYVKLGARRMQPYAVHADIAGQLQMIFDTPAGNTARVVNSFVAATKNAAVVSSMFHVKSLFDAFVGASKGKDFLSPNKIIQASIDQYRKGYAGDKIDDLLRAGLKVSLTEDSNPNALNSILGRASQSIDSQLDKIMPKWIPRTAPLTKSMATFNQGLHDFTFGYAQTGFKIHIAMQNYQKLVAKGLDPKQAAKISADYTNDIFGGLDWSRVAFTAQSAVMRKVAETMLSPSGRRIQQFALFAPDWTYATFRAAYKAMPGAAYAPELAQLHRQYVFRSAIAYMMVGNVLNYAFTGKSLFENKDPLHVNTGDGQRIALSKHAIEPFEYLRHPGQVALNKLSYPVKTPIEIFKEEKYLSAKGSAPPIETIGFAGLASAMHAIGNLFPIVTQQVTQNDDPWTIAGGFMGVPTYGRGPEQRAEDKQNRRRLNRENRAKGRAMRDY